MDAEDLLRDYSGYGKSVECVNERLPDFDITSSLAFIVESVNSRHISTLVVAPQKEKVLRELELVAQQ